MRKNTIAVTTLVFLALSGAAVAQGVIRGAADGSREGNHAAGPVGAVVGGVAGAVGGGVAGLSSASISARAFGRMRPTSIMPPTPMTGRSTSASCCPAKASPITMFRRNMKCRSTNTRSSMVRWFSWIRRATASCRSSTRTDIGRGAPGAIAFGAPSRHSCKPE